MTQLVLVLLVDDEHLIRDLMEITLEDAGFSVVSSASAQEAFAVLSSRPDEISALLTDVRLGNGETGWEVARHARHLKPEMPVVYMTGDSGAAWTAEGVPKSVLLQKPFAPAQAITALATLLNEVSSTPPSS